MMLTSGKGTALLGLISSIVLSAAGQLGMKIGMKELHALASSDALSWATARPAASWTIFGLLCYGISLLTWLAALVRYPLSFAYPLLGLSYVLVYLGATRMSALMEPATLVRSAGTVIVIIGVALVSVTHD
jgi:undecaprenyl phosphate-alpha-L-ara4N flippase subunit ArnF